MSEDRPDGAPYPRFPATIHSEVAAECRDAYAKAQPWTQIRPLQKGVDDPQGYSCNGCQGQHHLTCTGTLEAVQYTTAFGDPVFYCEDHALKQNDWDIVHYRSTWKAKKLPAGWQEEVDKMVAGWEKKRRKKEEAEEIDPS